MQKEEFSKHVEDQEVDLATETIRNDEQGNESGLMKTLEIYPRPCT